MVRGDEALVREMVLKGGTGSHWGMAPKVRPATEEALRLRGKGWIDE